MPYMPVIATAAFFIIYSCSTGCNQRVWLVLACHALANVLFNVFVFDTIEHDPWIVAAFLTAGDAVVVMFMIGIWNRLARIQTALISAAWLYQWIYVIEIHIEAYPGSSALTLIYEPLILAIGICQMLLGYNAISAGIRKLAANTRFGRVDSRSGLRPCPVVAQSKSRIKTERR